MFEVDGLTVWLPKFELARKMFFHAAFIVRAAFAPNGLDMAFTIYREGDVVHIHTPPKTGAPSQLLKIKGYRDHFSWLLLNQDVRRSFESIWQSLNQRQERVLQESAYARWQFDFQAPTSLAGTTMDVRGPFDPESNELLVWEIEKLQGLRFSHRGDIFSITLLSSYPSGERTQAVYPCHRERKSWRWMLTKSRLLPRSRG